MGSNPTPSATRLIIVRHGQTPCNSAEIWHGWDDCELNETGQAQAAAVAERLAGEAVTAVYSSDSPRAYGTAQAIAGLHGLVPIPDERLRERHAGTYEGRAVAEIVAERPTVWQERDADLWNWRPPEGESFAHVLARARPVIADVVARHDGGTVVLVTHMSTARVLISDLAGIPIEETYLRPFPSTGVSIFTLGDGEPSLDVLNDAAHLDGA